MKQECSAILKIPVIDCDGKVIRAFIKYGEELLSRHYIYCSLHDFCSVCSLSYQDIERIVSSSSVFEVIQRNGEKYLSIGSFQLIAVDLCTDFDTDFDTLLPFFKSVSDERVIAARYIDEIVITAR